MQNILPSWRTIAAVCTATFALATASQASAAGWIDATSPTTNGLYGIDCASGSYCVAVGENGTIINNHGSLTSWISRSSGITSTLNNVDVQSSSLAIAIGEGGVILRSTDNGDTWTSITSGTTENLFAAKMINSSVGWVAGEDSKILKTTDGGVTWSIIATAPSIDARAIDAVSTSTVWVAGKSGAIYRSTDGGTTWSDVSIATSNWFYGIDALNSSIAYVGGDSRSLYKTTNSGSSWTQIILPDLGTTEAVADLEYVNTTIGNLVGNAGSLNRTTDGSTYTTDTVTFSTTGIYDVAVIATGARYAVGASGLIAVYDNYGPNAPGSFAMADGEYTNDRTPTLTWTEASDDEGSSIDYYEMSTDSGSTWSLAGTSSESSFTFPSNIALGAWTIQLRAVDEVGNEGDVSEITFAIELTNPTVGSVSPTTATEDTATQFVVEASDTSGIASCTLYINSSNVGSMTEDTVSGDWTYSHTFTSAGTYSAYASCTDEAGNSAAGSTVSVTVAAGTGSDEDDTVAPTVGTVSPTSATEDDALTLSATVSDDVGISTCYLYVSGSSAGSMTVSGSTASKSYTFTSSGSKSVYVKCYDAAGNAGTGSTATVTVAESDSTTPDEDDDEAVAGDLMKLACPGGEDVNDPCRAVYYLGEDGKRHAFPNEKVFFTWFENFDDVVVVSSDFLASLTLGRNVTYHPGTRMVKFITVNTVYAVGEEGELRGIDSEETAISIWGSTWNQQIDDISDAFYGNYTFGDNIDSASDFDPDEVEAGVSSIDDIM